MFRNIINEYEEKKSYFFKIPNTKEVIQEHLKVLFPTVSGSFQGKSKEMDDLLIETGKSIDPYILKNQRTPSTKNYIITMIASNSFIFEKVLEKLNIKDGKNPKAKQWEEIIVKRGNYELATGYNYQANYIGMKVAMAIRKATDNYTDEFKMPSSISLNPAWSKLLFKTEKVDDESKTDIILGENKISLKKKGGSQIFSGLKGESYATLTYALNQFIEKNEESLIKKIDNLALKFENSNNFKKYNNFSAYLLTTFNWSNNVTKLIEMNRESFRQDIGNKASIILKSMATDYYKILKRENPSLTSEEFKKLFIDNIQKIWYDNLDDMSILEKIASNTESATDDEIFHVEEILTSIRRNYKGDSVRGKKKINIDSLDLIKKKISLDYGSKYDQYKKYLEAKKQFNMSTKILNSVFADNPEVKLHMIYEGITGDFKFNRGIGSANSLCSFNADNGEISYNRVDMAFVESIKDKFDITYSFKSNEDKIHDNSKAALRAYYFSSTESDLLNFHMINENFVRYLRDKYQSLSRALMKIILKRIRKIFKKATNKIKMLNKLFKTEIKRDSVSIKESYL